MTSLTEFLLARIEEDEAVAREAGGAGWHWDQRYGEMCNDPECPYGQLMTDDEMPSMLMEVHGYDVVDSWQGAPHIARHDPARVLAECEAKRQIVALHEVEIEKVALPPFDSTTGEPVPPEYDVNCEICGWACDDPTSGCDTLRLLASVYAQHPDYRSEWAPDA